MSTEEIDQLALAYKRGEHQVLSDLYRALESLIGRAVRFIASQGLPGSLEARDLRQQSWIILADLAQRWRPELGIFAAYVNTSMFWALGRYVRRYTPRRRATRVQVLVVDGQEMDRLLEDHAGEDGRAWDDRLVCQELLARLPEMERSALTLRALEDSPLPAVASRLGVSYSTARRLVHRARATLQDDAPPEQPDPYAELAALVRALHDGASPDGQVPGRVWVCAQTHLTQLRYAQLMRQLVAAGCIRGRSPRQPGWLVERDAEATLKRMEKAGSGLVETGPEG